MLNPVYCKILGIEQNSGEEEIKQAYRKLVRKYHPDRHPSLTQEKTNKMKIKTMEVKMMQINEAYEQLIKTFSPDFSPQIQDKDLSYTYYKQGFISYSEGAGGMLARGYLKLTPDLDGLNRVKKALSSFYRAHSYFQRVVKEYPASIWASDASYRLRRVERFCDVYNQIEINLQRKISEKKQEEEEKKKKTLVIF